MSEQISYGSYNFPTPTPFVAEGVEPVYVEGKVDHFVNSIDIVGNLTGENLSGLHLEKMKMISGLLPTFETLTITHGSSNKTFPKSKPQNISFDSSDLTTVLPYSVSFISFKSGTFAKFFGIQNPVDNWTFNEENGRVVTATHNVSAEGVKVGDKAPLDSAREFVTGRVTGFADLSLFLTGQTGYLMSRTEDIDKSKNSYGIQETYKYNTDTDYSGLFTSNSTISFDKDAGLNVNVNASIQGDFIGAGLANPSDGGNRFRVSTGLFTPSQAAEVAVNAVVSSLSNYESGSYTFIERGPTTVSYNVDTGTNKIDFSYTFNDPDNTDQIGNVLHTRSSSVSVSKDDSKVGISVQGELKYNSPFDIFPTGDPATGARFLEVDKEFSGIAENSGFLNLAIEALQDFTGDATGYYISGDYINPEPLSKSITKTPENSQISYSLTFDNRIDLSSGSLSGLKVSISDKKPLELSGIVPSLGGFAKQKINNRTAGEFKATASCEASTGELQQLIDVVSGHMTGTFVFDESSSLNEQNISYNVSRYY